MAFQETALCVGIESNTLCVSLMPPQLVYMSTRLLTTQIFDWQSVWMICVWMCLPSSSAHKLAFEHGHKGDRDYLHTIMLHFFGEFQCLLPLPTFHISSYYHTPRDSIMCRHSPENVPSILNAPTFSIYVSQGITHIVIRLSAAFNDACMDLSPLVKVL